MFQLEKIEPVIKTKLLKLNTIQLSSKFGTSLTAQFNNSSLDKMFCSVLSNHIAQQFKTTKFFFLLLFSAILCSQF